MFRLKPPPDTIEIPCRCGLILIARISSEDQLAELWINRQKMTERELVRHYKSRCIEQIIDWRGVVDDATDQPVPFSPEQLAGAIEQAPSILVDYIHVLVDHLDKLVESEKKGSGTEPSTTAEKARATANGAEPPDSHAPEENQETTEATARM